ncbi:unnamed protein product [Cunninghamella blakesleeana]
MDYPYQLQSLEYPYCLLSPIVSNHQIYKIDIDNEKIEVESEIYKKENQIHHNSKNNTHDDYNYHDNKNSQDHDNKEDEKKITTSKDKHQQLLILLLDDLFYQNGNKIQAAYTIISIELDAISHDEVRCNINHILNIFPNLKELYISFAKLLDFDIINRKTVELVSSSVYPLEKLTLNYVDITLNAGLTRFFKNCPKLNTICWSRVNFNIKHESNNSDLYGTKYTMIIDLKHLHMDKIEINSMYINQVDFIHNQDEFIKVIVNEVRENETKETIESSQYTSPLSPSEYSLQINCQSVDIIHLK